MKRFAIAGGNWRLEHLFTLSNAEWYRLTSIKGWNAMPIEQLLEVVEPWVIQSRTTAADRSAPQ